MGLIGLRSSDSDDSDWDIKLIKAINSLLSEDFANSVPSTRVLPPFASSSSDSDSDDSDWDIKLIKAINSLSEDFANSVPSTRVLPPFASSSSDSDSDDSDWDIKLIKAINSLSEDFANSVPSTRVLPPFASSSGTTSNADSKRMPSSSFQPSSSSFRPSVPARGPRGIQIREKPYEHECQNNLKDQLEDTVKGITLKKEKNHASKVLPPSVRLVVEAGLQDFRQPETKKDLPEGTLIDGQPIIILPPKTTNLTSVDFSTEERAFDLTSKNHLPAEMEDTISRAGIDSRKERNHGSRVLPPMSVPTTSYGGPPDPYRPGAVVDELVGDERLIYHKEIDQSSRKRQRCSDSPQTPKRAPGSSTSTGSSRKSPPSSPQHFTKSPPHYNNFHGELIQSLLEDINKDCAIAKALQAQIDELVRSIDLKNKLVDKLQKSFS